MKKCPKCKNLYKDECETCPDCGTNLQPYEDISTKIKTKFVDFVKEYNKGIISCALIAAFLLGFGFKSCTGIKRADLESVVAEKDKIQRLYDSSVKERENISSKFDAYKEKMKPYEAQQEADAKAAEEKKTAEEKAKKEAEEKAAAEKAAQEAEAKRQADELAKASSLGMTPKDFINQFNVNCATLGASITATVPDNFSSYEHLTTSNNSVSLDISTTENGYVSSVFVNYKNLNNNDGISGAYAMVAAAQAIDKSTSEETFTDFFNNMIKSATYGQDYEKTLNNIKYRINYEDSSLIMMIRK